MVNESLKKGQEHLAELLGRHSASIKGHVHRELLERGNTCLGVLLESLFELFNFNDGLKVYAHRG